MHSVELPNDEKQSHIVQVLIAVTILFYGFYRMLQYGMRAHGMPPGPPTFPIIGNLLHFPRSYWHLKFTEWASVYGDVFSVKVMNQTIIVINTPTLVREVIDKNGLSSINRPKSILADMITPDNMNMGTGRFANHTWKSMRNASAHLLNGEKSRQLCQYQHAEATQLMWDLTRDPGGWYRHIQRFTASFMLGIVYGKRGPRLSSPDVADFLEVHPKFMNALEIGTMPPVDLFPFLSFIPERWARWKRTVNHIRFLHETLYDRLLSNVEKRMTAENHSGAFMEQAIINAEKWGLHTRTHLVNLGGTLIEGSDTSSASLQNAVLILTRFPHVQVKARAEIDRVIGGDRVPAWEDLPNLPYTMAVIEEMSRYRPVGPLGLPHAMVDDQIIDGFLYPKDAAIFINIWGIFHDERYFDKAEEFIPERFLKHPLGVKEGVDDDPARRPNMLFGGGRRVCPGISIAKTSLAINVTNFLWAFEFLPYQDPLTGKEMYPDLHAYTSGITATPKPFTVRIVPRSVQHEATINSQFTASSAILRSYEAEILDEDKTFND